MNPKLHSVWALIAAAMALVPVASADDNPIMHEIESTQTGRAQILRIELPASYIDNQNFDYPILVLLDGESNLDHTSAVVQFLAETGAIPEMIVVAVHAGATRSIDYSHTPLREGMPALGPQYVDFLRLEVLPFVERKYRAAPLRIISGHSLGGAFITSIMARHPDLFHAYIAQSPFLPGDFGETILNELAKSLEHDTGHDLYYYANLGDEPDLASAFARLDDIVSNAETMRATTKVDPRKTHMSTRLIGLYDGLERFFENRWSFNESTDSLRDHVAGLSEAYGYNVLYAEGAFQENIQRALARGDAESALDAAALYAEQYSYSPVPHLMLAAARARSGDVEGARAAIRISIDRYEADPRPQWASIEPGIRGLAQQLGVGGVS